MIITYYKWVAEVGFGRLIVDTGIYLPEGLFTRNVQQPVIVSVKIMDSTHVGPTPLLLTVFNSTDFSGLFNGC